MGSEWIGLEIMDAYTLAKTEVRTTGQYECEAHATMRLDLP